MDGAEKLTKRAVDAAVEQVAEALPFEELRRVVRGDADACAAHDAAVKAILAGQGYDVADFEMGR